MAFRVTCLLPSFGLAIWSGHLRADKRRSHPSYLALSQRRSGSCSRPSQLWDRYPPTYDTSVVQPCRIHQLTCQPGRPDTEWILTLTWLSPCGVAHKRGAEPHGRGAETDASAIGNMALIFRKLWYPRGTSTQSTGGWRRWRAESQYEDHQWTAERLLALWK